MSVWKHLLTLLVLVFVTTTNCLSAPSQPLSVLEYDGQLGKIQQDVSTAISAGAYSSPHLLSRALVDLGPIVRSPVVFQGTIVVVDNRPLRSTLTRIETALPMGTRKATMGEVLVQISLIRSGLLAPDRYVEAQKAENTAKAVLGGQEFSSDPIAPPSLLEKKLDQSGDEIVNWLKRLAKMFHGPDLTMPKFNVDFRAARTVIFGVLILAWILLAYVLVRAIVGAVSNKRIKSQSYFVSSSLAMNEVEQELVAARDHARLIQLARQSADSGEYRNGYRLVYLSTLVLIDTTGRIRLHRSRTNWEYLRAIKSSGDDELYEQQLPLTSEFDRIWYGFGTVGRSDFDKALAAYQSISIHLQTASQSPSANKAVAV